MVVVAPVAYLATVEGVGQLAISIVTGLVAVASVIAADHVCTTEEICHMCIPRRSLRYINCDSNMNTAHNSDSPSKIHNDNTNHRSCGVKMFHM